MLLAASLTPAQDQPATQPSGLSKLVTPISNEISYFANVDDGGDSRGTTLQIISINEFNIGTNFIFEFTGDFNWDMNTDIDVDYDYYLELSLVKPVYKSLSVNYQRIYGTFNDRPVNQFGLRLSLFTGS
jgi:hypothetical protein